MKRSRCAYGVSSRRGSPGPAASVWPLCPPRAFSPRVPSSLVLPIHAPEPARRGTAVALATGLVPTCQGSPVPETCAAQGNSHAQIRRSPPCDVVAPRVRPRRVVRPVEQQGCLDDRGLHPCHRASMRHGNDHVERWLHVQASAPAAASIALGRCVPDDCETEGDAACGVGSSFSTDACTLPASPGSLGRCTSTSAATASTPDGAFSESESGSFDSSSSDPPPTLASLSGEALAQANARCGSDVAKLLFSTFTHRATSVGAALTYTATYECVPSS